MSSYFSRLALAVMVCMLSACATSQGSYDYAAFRASKPASILVMPPLNASIDPAATAGVLSQATLPLAESGYYVVPVGVMTETFRQNGVDTPEDAHQVPTAKLREIFGADAVLYLTVTQYGSSYQVLRSATTVSLEAELLDLRTGAKLWEGRKTAAQASDTSGGLLGMLVNAVVDQVVNTLTDKSFVVADQASRMLLSAGQPDGLLYGPRSPHYEFK